MTVTLIDLSEVISDTVFGLQVAEDVNKFLRDPIFILFRNVVLLR